MKILLYSKGLKNISKAGIGKAIKHQMKALEENNIDYTLNEKEDYDIMHINTWWLSSYLAAKKAKKQGKKVVYHAHSTEEDIRNSFLFSNIFAPLLKKWLIKCYSVGDHIITPTTYSKKILEGYGITKPITAISNGIELTFFEKNETLANNFRKMYNYKKSDKIVIGIGLYIERKGIVDFVEIAKNLPEYKFIWFGSNSLLLAGKKVRKAVNTKLDNLIFAGYVDPSIIKGAMSGANLYIFPTYEETEGIPTLEALACKQNLLVRDIPVFDPWLKDNVNCYKAKNIDELILKTKQIITKKLPNLNEEGYKLAKRKSVKNSGKALLKVYKEVLNEK